MHQYLSSEAIKGLLHVCAIIVYLVFVSRYQAKNLRTLNALKSKQTTKEEKQAIVKQLKKLMYRSPLYLLIVAFIHTLFYLLFEWNQLSLGYFLSILLSYAIFTSATLINFWLKGAGILKDIGDFNGLPGN